MTTSVQDFERIASTLRWHEKSIACARDVLVGGMAMKDAAEKHSMSQPQVAVIKRRFMDKLRAAQLVVLSADEYMGRSTLQVFRPELTKLRNAGYSDLLLLDFLSKNGVDVSAEQLTQFLDSAGNGHENTNAGKSKRRSR